MKKITINDVLSGNQSRYALVIAVAKRARSILENASEEQKILQNKSVLLAIDDFKQNKYEILIPEEEDLKEEAKLA